MRVSGGVFGFCATAERTCVWVCEASVLRIVGEVVLSVACCSGPMVLLCVVGGCFSTTPHNNKQYRLNG